jgi:hypothetical protein
MEPTERKCNSNQNHWVAHSFPLTPEDSMSGSSLLIPRIGDDVTDVATPALLLDMVRFEANRRVLTTTAPGVWVGPVCSASRSVLEGILGALWPCPLRGPYRRASAASRQGTQVPCNSPAPTPRRGCGLVCTKGCGGGGHGRRGRS